MAETASVRSGTTRSVTSPGVMTASEPATDSKRASPQQQIFTPSNDSMYALYLNLCGQYSIRKPNKFLLAMMPADESKTLLPADEDGEVVPGLTQYNEDGELLNIRRREQENEDSAPVPASTRASKFSERKGIDLSGQLLGTSGICCLLELIRECPYWETIDLSPLPNLFAHDALKTGIEGNKVIELLAEVAASHPGLCSINLTNHSVGSIAVQQLAAALEKNANLIQVTYKMDPVNPKLNEKFRRALDKNTNGMNLQVPSFPIGPSDRMSKMQMVDRKTSKEQQALHLLLYECRASFGGVLSTEEMSELVLNAHMMQLGEVINFCRGLRGDEENMFLLAAGCLEAVSGSQRALLGRGDYFGEPLESAQYTAGRLSVKERGHCYRIPHRYVKKLADRWDQRVSDLLPFVKPIALLQSLPLWVVFRLCHDATFRRFQPGEVAIKPLGPFQGIFLVIQGQFIIDAPPREAASSLLAAHQLRDEGTLVPTPLLDEMINEGEGKNRGSRAVDKGSARRLFSLGEGDFFGEEAAVSKNQSSTVEIRAAGSSNAPPPASHLLPIAIQLDVGSSQRHVVKELKAALQLQTQMYSRHDMYNKQW